MWRYKGVAMGATDHYRSGSGGVLVELRRTTGASP